jgi:hypothetical protein
MRRPSIAVAAGGILVALAGAAAADVLDAVKIGRWNGGALNLNGAVTQCVVASRFKGAGGPTDARTYSVFHSVSRAAGFAIAIQDMTLKLEPGRSMAVRLKLDGAEFAKVEGKAVGPNVVAFYPADAARLKADLAKTTSVVAEIDNVPYGYPAEEVGEVVAWLDGCAGRHGLAGAGFDKGREDEERKLGQ